MRAVAIRIGSRSNLHTSLFVLALAAAPLACSDATPAGSSVGQDGSVDLALSTNGVSIDSVSYVITGPAGYSKSGSVGVSHSATLTAVIGSIPAGNGYSITLNAAATSGGTTCSGSAPFSVVAHQTLPVAVDLLCREVHTTGSVLINGVLNVCASLNDVSAVPNEVTVGASVTLSADATDSDGPSPISYQWTADGGTLSAANAQTAALTCTTASQVHVSVRVSDGDAGCTQETGSVVITCIDGGSGGTGGSAGAGGMSASGAAGAAAGSSNVSGSGGAAGDGVAGSGTAGSGGSSGAGAGGTGGNAAAGAAGANVGGAGAGGAGASGAGAGSGGASNGRNVVIYRVGDGSGSLVSTGNPVFVDEYTASGAAVRSTKLPVADNGSIHALVASGTATSEGLISLSADGHFLLLSGYDSSLPGPALAGSSVPRVVGRIDALGNVDTSTALTDWAPANNPRSVTSTNGSDLWIAGAAGGVRFTTLGATTSTQLSTTVANIRQTNIFGSQLYVSDSSGSAVRLGAVGTGLPTTSGQTIVNLPGVPASGTSPYGFFFADLDDSVPGVDVLYIADDGIGVLKYALTSTSPVTWTAEGTVGTASDAYRGITGMVAGGSVTLFATRKGGSAAAGGGEIVTLVDASGRLGALAGTPTSLLSASANVAFRGIALAPLP